MSVKNFIPKLWAAAVERELEKSHVLVARCNRNYEGMISNAGDTVKINGIGAVSVNDYTSYSDISFEQLSDASTELVIDQKKYFAFEIDDVDAAQVNADVFGAGSLEAAYALSDAADQFIAAKYSDAGITVTEANLDSSNITSTFARLRRSFSENNVSPNTPLWCVVPPIVIEKLILGKLLVDTDNSAVLASGALGRYMGFDIYESNNLTSSGTEAGGDLNFKCMAGTSRAITYADQIIKMEALSLEKRFNDALKGLHVYGAKVVRPKELALLDVTIEDETNI